MDNKLADEVERIKVAALDSILDILDEDSVSLDQRAAIVRIISRLLDAAQCHPATCRDEMKWRKAIEEERQAAHADSEAKLHAIELAVKGHDLADEDDPRWSVAYLDVVELRKERDAAHADALRAAAEIGNCVIVCATFLPEIFRRLSVLESNADQILAPIPEREKPEVPK